jgi:hypothetical protein
LRSEQEIRERLKLAKKELDIAEQNQPHNQYDDMDVSELNQIRDTIDSEVTTLEWILEIKYEE